MLHNVRRKVTETLINSKTIADAQVSDETQSTQQHRGFIRGPCYCSSPPCDEEKPKTEVEKKKTLKEADKQRLKMRRKDSGRKERRGQGEEIKKRGDEKTDVF